VAVWFTEWAYGYFRTKGHSHGVKARPCCVGEVAIAVEKGKTVIPIQLAKTAEPLQ
jgi:hypothetical protein